MTPVLTHPPELQASPVAALLGDATVRRRILALVRQHVPAADVHDVAQSVFCDALASSAPDPSAPIRWLFGIARHKIADHYRARGRSPQADADLDFVPAQAPPLEARSVLSAIEAETRADPRSAETLRWIAQASDGEPLDAIARAHDLGPEAVRQRVSRLRRALRLRFGAFAAVALLLLGGRAITREHGLFGAARPIAADVASIPAELRGTWRVVSREGMLPAASHVRVDDGAVTVLPAGPRLRVQGSRRADGAFELAVIDGAGRSHAATAHLDASGALVVQGELGRAVLRRD